MKPDSHSIRYYNSCARQLLNALQIRTTFTWTKRRKPIKYNVKSILIKFDGIEIETKLQAYQSTTLNRQILTTALAQQLESMATVLTALGLRHSHFRFSMPSTCPLRSELVPDVMFG